jgi:hypothetical protein
VEGELNVTNFWCISDPFGIFRGCLV